MAVRNMVLVTTTPWYAVNVRKLAIRRSVPCAASLPREVQSDLRMG